MARRKDRASDPEAVGVCPRCDRHKVSYPTRKIARRAGKRLHPDEKLKAYPCGNYFHLGHDDEWRRVGVTLTGREHDPLPPTACAQINAMMKRETVNGSD